MRLHAVTMVRDEEDIIEVFARHTLHFVDELHVVVHRSLDGTKAILDCLAQEGLALNVTVSSDVAFRQGATLTALVRKSLQAGADFVFAIDADEFIRATSREELEGLLSAMPEGAVGGIPWQMYVPAPEDDPGDPNVLSRITHRRAEERKVLGKLALGRSFLNDESLHLLEGAHFVFEARGGEHFPLPLKWIRGLQLAHFPVRSIDQAIPKLLQRRWQRRIAWVDEPIARLVASGARSMFDRMTEIVLERGTLTPDELSWLAYAYNDDHRPGDAPPFGTYTHQLVHDPCVSLAGDLKYADRRSAPSAALYRWMDELVSQGRGSSRASDVPATPAQTVEDRARTFSSQAYLSSYSYRKT